MQGQSVSEFGERLLSVEQTAEMICCSTRHVYRLVAADEMAKPVNIGKKAVRFLLSDVLAYIEKIKGKRG